MNADDRARWAQRRTGGQAQQAPATQVQQHPQAQHPQVLSAPPPGYAWMQVPGVGLVLVQQAPVIPPPIQQQPVVMPFIPPSFVRPPSPQPSAIETCALMKPDGRDPYADMMASVPSLVPDQGFDAMKGNPNPAGLEEVQRAGYSTTASDDIRPFPEGGKGVPLPHALPLK